jgi:hypothetical protein
LSPGFSQPPPSIAVPGPVPEVTMSVGCSDK